MKSIYDNVSVECSKNITQKYSTSFSLGIKLLNAEIRNPIYSVYGFVRLADEIVDTFEGYQQAEMLKNLTRDTYEAIDQKISINPVLNSFQKVVHDYNIDRSLIQAFLESMEMDLTKQFYNQALYEKYIFGSAEVVGLMCLKVFCKGNEDLYNHLKASAMKLGSAFQKINFLRDIKADYEGLGRLYFPNTDFTNFSNDQKAEIEKDILNDFNDGLVGIKQLPTESRLGVFLAYIYYKMLFRKIKAVPGNKLLQTRIRVANYQKMALLMYSVVVNRLNLIH
jgi:phytoene synthase